MSDGGGEQRASLDAMVTRARAVGEAHEGCAAAARDALESSARDLERALVAWGGVRKALEAREMKAVEELTCIVDNCDAVAARAKALFSG